MLRAGFGWVDITPPVGCCLQGHFQKIVSAVIHDPLYVSNVAIGQPNNKLLLHELLDRIIPFLVLTENIDLRIINVRAAVG